MEISIGLIKQIASLFIMIGIGYFLVKRRVVKVEDSKVLSTFVLYVACPCVIINSFQIELTKDNIQGFLLALFLAIIAHIIFILLAKFLSSIFHFNAIEKASIIYPNTGNLIIPLVQILLGPQMVFYCSAAMVVQNVLFWTHCRILISEDKNINLKNILYNVNIIAIIIGIIFFFTQIKLPIPITSAMSSMGTLMGPLSMFVIGMLLAKIDLKTVLTNKKAYIIASIRLILFPTIIMLIYAFSPLKNLVPNGKTILLISLLGASAPSASTVTQFAQIFDNHPFEASAINVLTVLFCIITMPLIIMAYQLLV